MRGDGEERGGEEGRRAGGNAMFPFLQREIDLVVALGLSEFILR